MQSVCDDALPKAKHGTHLEFGGSSRVLCRFSHPDTRPGLQGGECVRVGRMTGVAWALFGNVISRLAIQSAKRACRRLGVGRKRCMEMNTPTNSSVVWGRGF